METDLCATKRDRMSIITATFKCDDERSRARRDAWDDPLPDRSTGYPELDGVRVNHEWVEFCEENGYLCLYRAWEEPALYDEIFSLWRETPLSKYTPNSGAVVAAIRRKHLSWARVMLKVADPFYLDLDKIREAAAEVDREARDEHGYTIQELEKLL